MLGFTYTPSSVIGVLALVAAMALVVVFNRQVARVLSYLSLRSSERSAQSRILVSRILVVLWALGVMVYALLWLLGLVNPNA